MGPLSSCPPAIHPQPSPHPLWPLILGPTAPSVAITRACLGLAPRRAGGPEWHRGSWPSLSSGSCSEGSLLVCCGLLAALETLGGVAVAAPQPPLQRLLRTPARRRALPQRPDLRSSGPSSLEASLGLAHAGSLDEEGPWDLRRSPVSSRACFWRGRPAQKAPR